MKARSILLSVSLATGTAAVPLAATAQPAPKPTPIGWLAIGPVGEAGGDVCRGRCRTTWTEATQTEAVRAVASASEIITAQTKDPVDAGRSLFSTACSRCHGADGVGGGTGGAVPPLKNYDGGLDKFMRMTMNGRKNTTMGGFKGILTEDEALTIYKYLTSFSRQ